MPNILEIFITSEEAGDKRVRVHANNPCEITHPIIEVEAIKNENITKKSTASLHDGLKQLNIRLLWEIPTGWTKPKNQIRRIAGILLIENLGDRNQTIVMIN